MAESKLFVVIGAKIADFEAKMREVNKSIKEVEKNFKGMQQMGQRFIDIGQKLALGLTLPITGLAAAAVKTSMDLETAWTGVIKTVDATEEELANLKQGFDDMARRIPIATTELYGVGEAAGQLGIKKENILGFSEVMAKLGVTTNLSSQDAATALARLANITQMPQQNFDRLGATIVDLGNNLATTEREIVEMGLRLAGAGKQVGMTEAQILGFAGALSSVGIEAEMGGSAFSRVMLDMQNAVLSGNENLRLFAQVAGMSSQEFQKAFKENAAGAIIAFIEGLGRVSASGQNVVPILEALNLSEIRVRDALLRAAGAGDLFRNSIELGSRAWEENNALNEEAEKRFKTAASQFQLLKNRVGLLAGAFGGILTPAILSFLKPFQFIIDQMSKMNETTKKVVGIVLLLVASIGPLILAIGTMMKLMPVLTLGVRSLGAALAWLAANPLGAIITMIGAAIVIGTLLYQNMDKIKYYGVQAWKSLKIAVMSAIKSMLGAMENFIGWIPGISDKIREAKNALEKEIAHDQEFKVNLAVNFSAAQEAKKVQEEIEKIKTGTVAPPKIEPGDIPEIQLPGADKSVEAAEKVKTAWIGTSDALKSSLETLRTQHETAAIAAEIQGDKLAQLQLKGQQLNEELAKQKEIVARVREEIAANTAAGVLEGETQEDLARRTDELNKKLADEEKAQAEIEKQIYDTNQAIKTQAQDLRNLADEVTKAKQKYQEDLAAALEDYQKKVKETNAKLAEDEKKLTQEYENQVEQRARSLRDFVGLFEAVTAKDISGTELLENLRGQVKAFEDWQENIAALAARGVDEGLIEELRQMGPKAGPEIAALNTLTDAELQEYVSLWRTKNEEARAEAVNQLTQQRAEMEMKLAEIRAAAQQQLELYRAEWEKKNAEIRKNAEEEMKRIEQRFKDISEAGTKYGVSLMENFIGGIESQFDRLQSVLEQMAMTVDSYMPHSPAKVGPLRRLGEWGPSLVKSLAEGIKAEIPRLSAVATDLAAAIRNPVVNVAPAPVVMAGGGPAGPVTINIYGHNYEEIASKLKRDLARAGVRF